MAYNYFDANGNYINDENLSLADIYHRAFALGVESVAISEEPQGELVKAINTIKAVCSTKNNCVECPMNHNCGIYPAQWEV